MHVMTCGLEKKVGRDGFGELELVVGDDIRTMDGVVKKVMERRGDNTSVILLLHSGSLEEGDTGKIRNLLVQEWFHVLYIGTSPLGDEVRSAGLGERAVGLDYGVPSGMWTKLGKDVRQRLKRFVKGCRGKGVVKPPWDLLKLPAVPEHVIACYLAAVAGKNVFSDEWREAFEEEVEYWCEEREQKIDRLGWEDRNRASRILEFLEAAGAVARI